MRLRAASGQVNTDLCSITSEGEA